MADQFTSMNFTSAAYEKWIPKFKRENDTVKLRRWVGSANRDLCQHAYMAAYACYDFWLKNESFNGEVKDCIAWKRSQSEQMKTMRAFKRMAEKAYPNLAEIYRDIEECEEFENLVYRHSLSRPTRDEVYD